MSGKIIVFNSLKESFCKQQQLGITCCRNLRNTSALNQPKWGRKPNHYVKLEGPFDFCRICLFRKMVGSLRGQHVKGRKGGGKLNLSTKCKESMKRDHWDLGGNACKEAIVFFIPPSQL